MLVTIDEYAGFCHGVIRAVRNAEKILEKNGKLLCLGNLVHNDEEIKRLSSKGLKTVTIDELKGLKHESVIFRAHGEPPESYILANQNKIELHDNTCGIVKRLQKNIRKEFEKPGDKNIVIFGKRDHPEVIGLAGQANNTAIIIEKESDIGKIDFTLPVILFSQTTMNADKLDDVVKLIEKETEKSDVDFQANFTICDQVSKRVEKIKDFSKEFDVIIFVSGKKSSNGKYLFGIIQEINQNSYWVSNTEEINSSWFENATSVGISGATSTPPWLLEKVAAYLKKV